MFDGRELSTAIEKKGVGYPSRPKADRTIEVHTEHAKNTNMGEHLLVATKTTFQADLAYKGFFKSSKQKGGDFTKLPSGKLYFLGKATQVYVTDYDKIVPFATLIKEVKDEVLGPHLAEFHWTACRSCLPQKYFDSEKLMADMCLEAYRDEGDTRLRELV